MKGTARLVVIDSVWGHMGKLDLVANRDSLFHTRILCPAGGGSNKQDTDFMVAEIKKFLEE